MIVALHDHRHRTTSPEKQFFQSPFWVCQEVEVIEVDVEGAVVVHQSVPNAANQPRGFLRRLNQPG